MKTKKILKIAGIVVVSGIIIGGSVGLYMFNMPHRDVQSTKADYLVSASELVVEYLDNKSQADEKYLAADGESKILQVTGTIQKVSEDFNGNTVLLLKSSGDKAGVSATFNSEISLPLTEVAVGDLVTVKGVIRSGAAYDADLEIYLNVILEKSTLVN
jgi:hypothetical protein